MSHKSELLPRKDGESLTDWTLRFLADGQRQLISQKNVQEFRRSETTWDEERRRLRDLYDTCTPREVEYAESPLDDEAE